VSFLLCWKVGLRISEAIGFDLSLEHQEVVYKNLYLLRGKRNKERWVFVGSEIVKELKKRNWQPNTTNRISFFDFLGKVKEEMNLSANIELSPHTLRRCFATYNAISGMPLPVLQKVLGHSKISTTALYIKDSDLGNLVKFRPV
jgi:integrase/recombinase XerD